MKLKFPIFYAPDNGLNVAVPAESSPTGQSIDTTPRSAPPAPEIHQLESIDDRPIRQRGVKDSKVDVAKELGLSKAPSDFIKDEAQRVRDEAGRFKKKDPELFPDKSPTEPPPQLGEPTAKPIAKKAEKPPEPVAPVIAKVKIGDKEMTPDEIQAELKSLREKAEAAAKPPATATPAAPKAPDAPTKTVEEMRQAFIAAQIARQDDISEKDLDVILSGGKDALAKFREVRARDKAEEREFIVSQVNPIIDDLRKQIKGITGQVTPLSESFQQNTAQQNADKFMNANQDIKMHPNGYEMMVERSARLNREYAAISRLMKDSDGDDFVDEYAERLKEISGDNFFSTLALEVRSKLGLTGQAAPITPLAPVAPVAAPVAQPKALRPPPQGGTLGVSGTPKKSNEQGSQVQELMASARW